MLSEPPSANSNPIWPNTFQTNFEALKQELQDLDRQLQALTANGADIPLVASHPVYDYLAQRYGLNLKSVLWEPDVMPDEVQWQELETLVKEHPAQWMLWEAEPNPRNPRKIRGNGY